MMNAITYHKVKEKLGETMRRVCSDHDPVLITRSSGAVVMISLEDYESMMETNYLLKSPKNARRLLTSIKNLEKGEGQERELLE